MNSVARNARADTAVMGRMMDTRVHPYGEANGVAVLASAIGLVEGLETKTEAWRR